MKVRKLQIPMDQISVSEGQRRIFIWTHRHTICFAAYDDEKESTSHEFTFEQLHSLIRKLRYGIQNDV